MDPYFITIRPTNTSGKGDPKCELTVTHLETVLREPIEAKNAADMEALEKAVSYVAKKLGIPKNRIRT